MFGTSFGNTGAFGSTTSPFGANKPAGGLTFGSTPTPAFGATGATTGFGSRTTGGTSLFGGAAKPAFGAAPAPAFGASAAPAFGAAPAAAPAFGAAPAASPFGVLAVAGVLARLQTVTSSYAPTEVQDGGTKQSMISISAAEQYKQNSFEELRVEDYIMKGNFSFGSPAPAPATGGLVGVPVSAGEKNGCLCCPLTVLARELSAVWVRPENGKEKKGDSGGSLFDFSFLGNNKQEMKEGSETVLGFSVGKSTPKAKEKCAVRLPMRGRNRSRESSHSKMLGDCSSCGVSQEDCKGGESSSSNAGQVKTKAKLPTDVHLQAASQSVVAPPFGESKGGEEIGTAKAHTGGGSPGGSFTLGAVMDPVAVDNEREITENEFQEAVLETLLRLAPNAPAQYFCDAGTALKCALWFAEVALLKFERLINGELTEAAASREAELERWPWGSKPVQTPMLEHLRNTLGLGGTLDTFLEEVFHRLDANEDGKLTIDDFAVLRLPRPPSILRRPSLLQRQGSLRGRLSLDESLPTLNKLPSLTLMKNQLSTIVADREGSQLLTVEQTQSFEDIDGVLGHWDKTLRETCRYVGEELQVPADEATVLLCHCNWDESVLLEAHLYRPVVLRNDAGLAPAGYLTVLPCAAVPLSDGLTKPTCGICLEAAAAEDGLALWCTHFFCKECWMGYVESKLEDRCVAPLRCAMSDCRATVTEGALRALDLGTELEGAVRREVLRNYLERGSGQGSGGPKVVWCRNPKGCEGVISLQGRGNWSNLECGICGYTFCSQCDLAPHAPATCEMLRQWQAKDGFLEGSEEELESRKIKHLTTKPCPKCGVPIEKNGGCSHMTCGKRQGGCGYEFCWYCLGPYHTSGECNRPKVMGGAGSPINFAQIDKEVANTFLGLRVAERQLEETAVELHGSNSPEITKVLSLRIQGWSTLILNLRALGYASVMNYFLPDTLKAGLIDKYNIAFGSLEEHTRWLQEHLEENWRETDLGDGKGDPLRHPQTQEKASKVIAALNTELGRFQETALALVGSVELKGLNGEKDGQDKEIGAKAKAEKEAIPCELCDQLIGVANFRAHLHARHGVKLGSSNDAQQNGKDASASGFGSNRKPFLARALPQGITKLKFTAFGVAPPKRDVSGTPAGTLAPAPAAIKSSFSFGAPADAPESPPLSQETDSGASAGGFSFGAPPSFGAPTLIRAFSFGAATPARAGTPEVESSSSTMEPRRFYQHCDNGDTMQVESALEAARSDLQRLRGLLDYREDRNGRSTPLHMAARRNRFAVAQLLLGSGADMNSKKNDGWAPLHLAAANGHEAIVRLLVEAGADKFIQNSNGRTPLQEVQPYRNTTTAIREMLSSGRRLSLDSV